MTKPFPGFKHTFQLSDPLNNRYLRGSFSEAKAFELTRAEISVEKPVHVKWKMGGAKPADFIWTTAAHPVVIHERVRQLLLDFAFTGWSTYPVVVSGKGSGHYPDYHGLSICGRCGPLDLEPSEIVLREYPAGLFPHLVGHFFDVNTWNGSDFFMHQPDSRGKTSSQIFVTEAVCVAMRRARFRNVEFTRLSEISVSTSVYEIGQSYNLPREFKERVARAYEIAGVTPP